MKKPKHNIVTNTENIIKLINDVITQSEHNEKKIHYTIRENYVIREN